MINKGTVTHPANADRTFRHEFPLFRDIGYLHLMWVFRRNMMNEGQPWIFCPV